MSAEAGPAEWPAPFELTTFGSGRTYRVDWKTRAALEEAERRLGYPLTLVQGSYNRTDGATEGGTHSGGGVVDVLPWDWKRKVRVLREIGFAAWYRPAVQGLWGAHVHAVMVDHGRLAPMAARQVVAYRAGRDGLEGDDADTFWRPDPLPVFAYPPTYPPTTSDQRAELEAVAPTRDRVSGVGTIDGAGNDAVGTTDQLGFQPYVVALADLITSPYSRPPLTIGVFGSWGIGKSFLLGAIRTEVEGRRAVRSGTTGAPVPPAVHVVGFNAWEYSANEQVWPGLVRKIVKTLDEEVKVPWHRRHLTRLRWNLSRGPRRSWQAVAALALVGTAALAVAVWGERRLAAGAIAAVLLSSGAVGLIRAAVSPLTGWVTALFADGDYGRQIDFMEEIQHDLKELEKRLHAGQRADGPVLRRILVLIDDLDRCEPDKAVAVLQAVNLLLNFNSFIVCLGIDARIVTAAISKHYEGVLGESGASGYEYLDKIVQIPFRIPEPSPDEVRDFVALQLAVPDTDDASERPRPRRRRRRISAPDTDRARGFEEVDVSFDDPGSDAHGPPAAEEPEAAVPFTDAELEAFDLLVPHLRPNPRHLKRLINVYRLVRALARPRNESAILDNPAATLRWLVLWSQWPYTASRMMERLDEILTAAGSEDPGEDADGGLVDEAVADPLVTLLAEVAPRLDPQTRRRLDDDPDALRALLAVPGCGLTWEEIERVRRYTFNFNPAVEEYLRTVTARDAPDRSIGTPSEPR